MWAHAAGALLVLKLAKHRIAHGGRAREYMCFRPLAAHQALHAAQRHSTEGTTRTVCCHDPCQPPQLFEAASMTHMDPT